MTQRGVLASMQVLDVYGPLEMFACKPAREHFDVVFVAERAGEVASAQKASTVAEHDFASCPPLDILLVPGKQELCCIAVEPVLVCSPRSLGHWCQMCLTLEEGLPTLLRL